MTPPNKKPRPVAPVVDPNLVAEIRANRVVPWIGAGFSRPLGFPDMKGLLLRLIEELHQLEFAVPLDYTGELPADRVEMHRRFLGHRQALEMGARDYAEIASDIRESLVAGEQQHKFWTALRNALLAIDRSALQTSWGHYFLQVIGFGRLVTTNYDRLLERHVNETASVVTGADKESIDYFTRIAERDDVIFKLHGDIERPPTIPFSEDQFKKLYALGQVVELLNQLIGRQTILFIGTSLSSSEKYYDHIKAMMERCRGNGYGGAARTHYALLKTPAEEYQKNDKTAEMRALGIRVIWYDSDDDNHSQVWEYLANLAARLRPGMDPNSVRGDVLRLAFEPRKRMDYLAAQLAFEQTATSVTFVTPDLTNAIATDDYIRIDCRKKLMESSIYRDLGDADADKVIDHMMARRDNLIRRLDQRKIYVRALCSRKAFEASLQKASDSPDRSILKRLIERYRYTLELAADRPELEIRLSDGFQPVDEADYRSDSYALIVSPYSDEEGHPVQAHANMVLAFATQATFGAFQTHLIEANTELVRDRSARADELWNAATPEIESIAELTAAVQRYEDRI